jgi:hypothetical protein
MEQKPDISSSGAAKAEADPAYVNLKVKQQVILCISTSAFSFPNSNQDGAITHFRIKRSTQLKKVGPKIFSLSLFSKSAVANASVLHRAAYRIILSASIS